MKTNKLPFQVWILTLGAFAIGTAEFIIVGVLKDIATAFSITELVEALVYSLVSGTVTLEVIPALFFHFIDADAPPVTSTNSSLMVWHPAV